MSVWASAAELPWLHADRARAWLRTLAAVTALIVVAWVAMSHGGLDPAGKPLGADFVAFWTAAKLALSGAPAAAVYDGARIGPLQAAAFPAAAPSYTPFPYPPTFLLICLPLGLLPYLAALAVWVGGTGLAYWRVVRAWLGRGAGVALPALAFPAVLINLAHGQTAFLAAALFGAGAFWLGRRNLLAGACLGLLAFKPHLGLLIPVALVASRNWRAFAGAAISSVGLTLASTAVFGLDAWRAYPDQLALMRGAVEHGLLHPGKLQTVFSALRLWDAPLPLAYAGQTLVAALAAGLVALFAWRHPTSRGLGPVLVAASLLVSPYMLDYDLVLAAIPLAWLFAEAQSGGFRPWDKPVMLAAFVLPLVARPLAMQAGVPLAPFVLAALLAITLRRAAEPRTA